MVSLSLLLEGIAGTSPGPLKQLDLHQDKLLLMELHTVYIFFFAQPRTKISRGFRTPQLSVLWNQSHFNSPWECLWPTLKANHKKFPLHYLSYFCMLPDHHFFFFFTNTTQCWDTCKRSKRGAFCPPAAQHTFPTTFMKLVFSVLIWPFWFAQGPCLLTGLAVPAHGAALPSAASMLSPLGTIQCDSSTLCPFSVASS